jgi:hypothetical protein
MYPSIMAACNFCKDSKILTVLNIQNMRSIDIVDFLGHASAPEENSVYLCHKYLKLPDYKEMLEAFEKEKT